MFKIGGKMIIASRVAWVFAHGSIPDGLYVLHDCDTPACVNVDHLFLGTLADNWHDCLSKGRGRSAGEINTSKTRCLRGHAFDAANTGFRPDGRRYCRACNRANQYRIRQNAKKNGAASV
jgi:hypothetical protein